MIIMLQEILKDRNDILRHKEPIRLILSDLQGLDKKGSRVELKIPNENKAALLADIKSVTYWIEVSPITLSSLFRYYTHIHTVHFNGRSTAVFEQIDAPGSVHTEKPLHLLERENSADQICVNNKHQSDEEVASALLHLLLDYQMCLEDDWNDDTDHSGYCVNWCTDLQIQEFFFRTLEVIRTLDKSVYEANKPQLYCTEDPKLPH